MATQNHRTSAGHSTGIAHRVSPVTALRTLILLVYLVSLIAFPSPPVAAQSPYAWVAYNDCAWVSGQLENNITTYTINTTHTGLLRNYGTGANTGVTATLMSSGDPVVRTSGTEAAPGKDAYNTFHGKVSMPGLIQFGRTGWWVDVTFTGLNPAKTYTFATTANRGDVNYTNRITRFTISGVDATTNASTSGVTEVSSEAVAFDTGYNTVNGYVARWTGIQPGSDGTFKVRAQADGTENRTYSFSVFMLAEESGEPPVQYTLAAGDDGNGSVSLSPAGGTYNENTGVTLTPVPNVGYAFDSWSGDDAGDLVDNGNGTWSITMDANKAVTANFVEAAAPSWIAYNDLAWASGQPETNITKYTIPDARTAIGDLVDYATGDPVAAGVAVSVVGSPGVQVSEGDYSGAEANPGTDAYETFHGIADSTGVIYYGDEGWSVTLTFTGLDPAAEYIFATTANRNNSGSDYLDRISRFTISGVDAATNSSTSGVQEVEGNPLSAYFSTGYNTENGYVARWTGIRPGEDGEFTVTAQAHDRNEAYGPSVFMLAQGGGGPINQAPDAPEVVQPVDDATGVSTSPTLEVAVSDPNGDAMDVTFYGREVGADGEAGDPFTIIAIPDTQMATQGYPENFTAQTQWIVDNAATENIVFVTHLGDIVNTANSTTQWQNADAAMDLLDLAGIPYSVGPGNHDLTLYSSPTYYPDYFGVSRFTGKPWYQGAYDAANNYDNYSLFSASGMDFILINLRYQPNTAVLDWADSLLKTHDDRRGIIVSHSSLNVNNSWTDEGTTTFDALKDNPNLFLMLCGHMHTTTDGAAQRADLGDDEHTIHSVLADYQDFPNGGNGYLLKLQFVPGEDSIDLVTYSPTLPNTLSGEYNPSTLVYEMDGTTAAPFVEIGTVTGVASGASASLAWPGRLADTEYEWYAVATDGHLSTQSATWSFTTAGVANTAPVLDSIGDQTVEELVALIFDADAIDDDGDTLTFSLVGAPAGAAIDSATGAFSWTPTEAQGPGTYPFTVKVCDDAATSLCDEETISVTVNEVNVAPVVAAIGNQSVDELVALAFNASATDADLPANTLTFSLVGAPAGAAIDSATGAFSWTPTEAQGPGTYPFTVKVCDDAATSLCDEETISVTVNEVNVAPVADAQNVTTEEDSAVVVTLSGSDDDVPANVLAFAIVTPPGNGTLSGTAPELTYTPNANFSGPDSFTFTVNDGTVDSAPATVSITVKDANDKPILSPVGNQTFGELETFAFTATATDTDGDSLTFGLLDAPAGAAIDPTTGAFSWTPTEAQGPGQYTFTMQVCDDATPALCDGHTVTFTIIEINQAPILADFGAMEVNELVGLGYFVASATDADLPANTLTFSLVGAPAGAFINPSFGGFSWTPTEAQGPGSYTFTVRVCDDGDPVLCDDEQITVTVNEVNTAPILAAIGNRDANELTELTFTASATDTDLPANGLTFSLTDAPSGASVDPTDGTFSWTPTEAQGPGTHTFTVRVCDDGDPVLCDDEQITVTVNEVNTAPVLAAIGNRVANELTELTFAASATDTDRPANGLTFSLTDAPSGASVDPTDGTFSWTPTEAQGPGSYQFTVRVCDNGNPVLCDEETITVTVNEVGTAPIADSQSITTAEDTPVAVVLTGSDAEGDALTYAIVTPPTKGTLSGAAPNLTYSPKLDFNGADSFTFRVNDGTLDSTPVTVSITVTPVNDAPVANSQSVVTEAGTPFSITLTGTDVDGDPLTFTIVTQPVHGALSGTAPNLTYTPAPGYSGPDVIAFVASDGQLQSSPANVEILVVGNDVPMLRLYLPLVSRG